METLSERQEYKATVAAFKALKFSNEEITMVWRTVAAILHLGNIEFTCEFCFEFDFELDHTKNVT